MSLFKKLSNWSVHSLAGFFAVAYAWIISRSEFFETGLQFITPALVILIAHGFFELKKGGVRQGLAETLFSKSLITSTVLVLIIFTISIVVPMPAAASSSQWIEIIGNVVICSLMVVVVGTILFVIFFILYKTTLKIYSAFR